VGAIEPRHVVVPLRKFMPGGDFRMAEIHGVDTDKQQVYFQIVGAEEPEALHYDHLVFALGSVTKTPPIPGLKEHGFTLKSLVDAIEQRDRGIRLLELANSIEDPVKRAELLTFVVVGANFTGVEFAGEYHAFMTELAESYPNLHKEDIRMIMLERGGNILDAMRPSLQEWVQESLTERGVDIRLKTSIQEVGPDSCVLTTGERVRTRTVVWTAGVAPPGLLKQIPTFPLNERGYIRCTRDLRIEGFENVWAIGDVATVLSAEGAVYAGTAQNASRQGPLVADNILASMRGDKTNEFDFRPLGAFAAIGHRKAAADFLGRDFKGFIGWLMYRGAYLMKMPTLGTKVRLFMDWLVEFFFHSDPVQVGVHRQKNLTVPAPAEKAEASAVPNDQPTAYLR